MSDCIFCRIIKGEIPCSKVYEDDNVFAFLDIGPVNKGHTLVVPKKHSENMYSIDDEDAKEVGAALKKIASAVKKGAGADGITITQSNERAAGQVVPHTHFHVIPRFSGDGLKLWPQGKYEGGEAEEIKDKIKKNL